MPKFVVTIQETTDKEYIVEAESEESAWDMEAATVAAQTEVHNDLGGDMEITEVRPYIEEIAGEEED